MDGKRCKSSKEKKGSPKHLIAKAQLHALMVDSVVSNVLDHMSLNDLKSARGVCLKWSALSDPIFLKSVRYQINPENLEDPLCCVNRWEKKYEHIYLHNVPLSKAKLKGYFQKFGPFVSSLKLSYGETDAIVTRLLNWMRQRFMGPDVSLDEEAITSESLRILLTEDLPCLTHLILVKLPKSVYSQPIFGIKFPSRLSSFPYPHSMALKLNRVDFDFGVKSRFIWTLVFLRDLFATTHELCEIRLIFGNKKSSGLKDGITPEMEVMLAKLILSIRQLGDIHVSLDFYKVPTLESNKRSILQGGGSE